jgi:hypothetical protein
MTTKKWRTFTATTETPIIVKKAIRDAKINFLSHPAQLASVGEPVTFSVTTDWLPETVTWTIGDDTIECNGRQCMEITRTFEQPGRFDARVKVTFDDHPDVSDSAKIVVEE